LPLHFAPTASHGAGSRTQRLDGDHGPERTQSMEWLISLACGALGGNLGGMLFKKFSLGVVLNSIVGILGGAGGMTLMGKINATTGNEYVNQIAGGAV